jgi:hypothetical protein
MAAKKQRILTVSLKASRLRALAGEQARAAFGDRVARAFLVEERHERDAAMEFNAHLATELRLQAEAADEPSIWRTL